MPARTTLGPLVTRTIAVSLGAPITSANERPILLGALIGACAAVGATYTAYQTRLYLGQRAGIPDPALALMEDAVVASADGWCSIF